MSCVLCLQCLQHLDVSVLGELVPRLCELLKSGIGLGTKVQHIHEYVDCHILYMSVSFTSIACWLLLCKDIPSPVDACLLFIGWLC